MSIVVVTFVAEVTKRQVMEADFLLHHKDRASGLVLHCNMRLPEPILG
jgi:hypothetical protein